jgi:hypothetical protein
VGLHPDRSVNLSVSSPLLEELGIERTCEYRLEPFEQLSSQTLELLFSLEDRASLNVCLDRRVERVYYGGEVRLEDGR